MRRLPQGIQIRAGRIDAAQGYKHDQGAALMAIIGHPHYYPWLDDPDESDWPEDRIEEMGRRWQAHLRSNQHYRDAGVWKEELHPRGQPENAGQFGPGGGTSRAERSQRATRALRPKRAKPSKTDSITVQHKGRAIKFTKPLRAQNDHLVLIDVAKFDAAFAKQRYSYVGEGGTQNVIGKRYEGVKKYLSENNTIEASEVHFNKDGSVSFTNGRHRYAALRDDGMTKMPMALTPEALKNAEANGYVVEEDEARPEAGKAGTTGTMSHDEIKTSISKVAEDLDFPADRIGIHDGERPFELNGKQYQSAGVAFVNKNFDAPHDALSKNVILIYSKQVRPDFIDGLVSHEIEHVKYQTALNRYQAEFTAVMKEPREGATASSDPVMKADGSLKAPYDKKYPAYQAMHEAFFTKNGIKEFAEADGVSEYSYEWWKNWKDKEGGEGYFWAGQSAIHETLAEMAKIKYETGKFPEHMGERILSWRGEDTPKPSKAQMEKNAKLWRDLYRAVDKVWNLEASKSPTTTGIQAAIAQPRPTPTKLRPTVASGAELERKLENATKKHAKDPKGKTYGVPNEFSVELWKNAIKTRDAAEAVADKLDFPKEKIDYTVKPKGRVAADYDASTSTVTLYPASLRYSPELVGALMSHEITHHKFHMVEDHADSENSPVHAMFKQHMAPDNVEKLKASALGISQYSDGFWARAEKYAKSTKGAHVPKSYVGPDTTLAINETLCEIAYNISLNEKDAREKTPKVWMDFYDDLMKGYKTLGGKKAKTWLQAQNA
jgi:hypothetical protein